MNRTLKVVLKTKGNEKRSLLLRWTAVFFMVCLISLGCGGGEGDDCDDCDDNDTGKLIIHNRTTSLSIDEYYMRRCDRIDWGNNQLPNPIPPATPPATETVFEIRKIPVGCYDLQAVFSDDDVLIGENKEIIKGNPLNAIYDD